MSVGVSVGEKSEAGWPGLVLPSLVPLAMITHFMEITASENGIYRVPNIREPIEHNFVLVMIRRDRRGVFCCTLLGDEHHNSGQVSTVMRDGSLQRSSNPAFTARTHEGA